MPPSDPLPIEPAEAFDVTLRPPGSKSLTNRALVMAALARSPSRLGGVLLADDTRRMIEALRALGFPLRVDEAKHTVAIVGQGGSIPQTSARLHLGNAGTAMRFLTAALTLGLGRYTLDGIPRMRERPIGELVDPLNELGADIRYLGEPGFPPLQINAEPPGPIGGLIQMAPTLSSQFISALLMIGPYLERGLEIEFDGPVTSLPYVRMTLNLMKQFGAASDADAGHRAINVPGVSQGSQGYHGYDYPIEPDASNASYFLAAAAVVPGSRCVIDGLGSRSLQGDTEFCSVLGRMGCRVDQRLDTTCVAAPPNGVLRGVDVSLNEMPDMAQTLAVVALFTDPGSGPTRIRNVGNLRVKETDRMAALENELTKFGARVEVKRDDLTIHPPEDLGTHEVRVETYDDHRMAMAFAVAGLRRPNVTILDPRCVEKTFPDYFAFLDRLRGAAV